MSAPRAREARLAGAALRCYPASWRRRHADEAAELAALLIRDGTPAVSVAWSYVAGAAREWLTLRALRPGRSPGTVAAALLTAACLLGSSAALVAGSASARAAVTTRSPSPQVSPAVRPARPGARSGPAPCRPVVPRQAAGARHPQPRIREAEHAYPC
jgi:hypothetical protein